MINKIFKMPPCDYKEYVTNWKDISHYIRFERAENKCEWCGVPNAILIYRPHKNKMKWELWPEGMQSEALNADGYKATKICLTVAHIDHNKNNNDYANLAALCQRCHLGHDIKTHVANRKYGRKHKGEHQFKIF